MNPLERMKLHEESFSDTDKKIYSRVMKDPGYVTRSGIVGLAEWAGVSQPSITRFCQKIGYNKFIDFKQDMYRFVLGNQSNDLPKSEASFLNNYIHAITVTDDVLTKEFLDGIGNLFLNAKNIYFTGIVESGIAGELLVYKLRRLGLRCFFIQPTELNDTLYFNDKKDLLVIFSARGPVKGNDLGTFIKRSEQFNGQIALVTMNKNYSNEDIDSLIVLPNPSGFESDHRISPTLIFNYFSEKLITVIASLLSIPE